MRRSSLAILAATFLALGTVFAQTALAAAPVTILVPTGTLSAEHAFVEGDELWVPAELVHQLTGFELKPQGLCAGDVCVPLPADGSWLTERDGQKIFCATRFAKRVDQAFAVDKQHQVWSFTAVPEASATPLLAGKAPDFELQDREGNSVRLSDFRGKKVLLWTWASWCTCRFDLAGWQKLYDELREKNFEIVACAQDSAGMDVARPFYDKAGVTFTALVDPHHTVSGLYQMVNVPSGVWIDETGQIVRPAEVAYSKQQTVLGQKIGDDRYAIGVRDWVENGPRSVYVLKPEELRSQIVARTPQQRQAEAEFHLGAYFNAQGNRELAAAHWKEAQRLHPESWNYHRQDWSFNKTTEMLNFLGKVKKLGDQPYYAPVTFPEPKAP